MKGRRALAVELRPSCINPSIHLLDKRCSCYISGNLSHSMSVFRQNIPILAQRQTYPCTYGPKWPHIRGMISTQLRGNGNRLWSHRAVLWCWHIHPWCQIWSTSEQSVVNTICTHYDVSTNKILSRRINYWKTTVWICPWYFKSWNYTRNVP